MNREISTQIKEGYLDFASGRLFYRQFHSHNDTQRPTLVFLHDALGSVEQWKSFPETLCAATGLNGLVFDRLGHGKSDPNMSSRAPQYMHDEALDVLPVVLKSMEIEKPILIGHSDGGSIALIYAAEFNPAAIICMAAHAFVEEKTLQGIKEAQHLKAFLLEKLIKYHEEKTGLLFEQWAGTWLHPNFASWNIEALLPKIKCSTLILQGSEDEYASGDHPVRIKHAIGPHAKYFLLEDCGHIPHLQAVDTTLRRIILFIEKLEQQKSQTINIE